MSATLDPRVASATAKFDRTRPVDAETEECVRASEAVVEDALTSSAQTARLIADAREQIRQSRAQIAKAEAAVAGLRPGPTRQR